MYMGKNYQIFMVIYLDYSKNHV